MATRKSAASQEGEGLSSLLDLDAIAQQRANDPEFPVKLGGKTYAMTSTDELSMDQQEDLERVYVALVRQQQGAEERDLLTDEQREMIRHLERRMIDIALPDAPQDVRDGLEDWQRGRIVKAFTNAVDMTGFLTKAVMRVRQQTTPTRPTLVRGNAGDTTARNESAPSPDSSSKAEAA